MGGGAQGSANPRGSGTQPASKWIREVSAGQRPLLDCGLTWYGEWRSPGKVLAPLPPTAAGEAPPGLHSSRHVNPSRGGSPFAAAAAHLHPRRSGRFAPNGPRVEHLHWRRPPSAKLGKTQDCEHTRRKTHTLISHGWGAISADKEYCKIAHLKSLWSLGRMNPLD